MSDAIIVSIITGALSLTGVIITSLVTARSYKRTSQQQTDLTLYRIGQLENKVELHNNAVERLYIAEGRINELQHEMKEIHRRDRAS